MFHIFGIGGTCYLGRKIRAMLLLKDEELDSLLSPAELVDVIQAAMIADEAGTHQVPQRAHIGFGDNTLLLMPAIGPEGYGTKVVSVMPGNPPKHLPMISGLYVLNDAATGAIVALMGTAKLTALRTGAIGGVGVKVLTDPLLESFVIIGCGVQSRMLARCICAVRPVREIICVTRGAEKFIQFRDEMQPMLPQVSFRMEHDIRKAISATSLVVSATTASEPVLPDDPELVSGRTFISIGSYRKDMQEFPDAIYRLSRSIIIDAEGIRQEVGDVINPVAKGLVKKEAVFTLGSVLVQKHKVQGNTVVFKSAGYALFDLFAARALHAAAIQRDAGTPFMF